MSSRSETLPRNLVIGVVLLTFVVLGLGGAVVVIKLRPAELPTATAERDIAVWSQRVTANPDDDGARAGLGIAYLRAGRTDDARGAFEDALDLNPANWIALSQLGLIVKDEDPAKAETLLSRAGENAPAGQKAVPLVALGDLLMQQDDPEGAKEAYEGAVKDAPIVFDAHLGLAKALEALGDEEGALKEYEQAARFDPSNQAIADAIARLEKSG